MAHLLMSRQRPLGLAGTKPFSEPKILRANAREVLRMVARTVKLVMLGIALAMLIGAVQKVQSEAPKDPLAEWAYPKAKEGKEGTRNPPLVWTTYKTPDAFEKVWEFYWQKIVKGAPVSLPPKVKSGTLYSTMGKEKSVCAHFYDDNPAGKLGVFVIREEKRTVSITILQRAKKKETTIVVVLDQR